MVSARSGSGTEQRAGRSAPSRKAFLFSIDALLAGVILISGIILVSRISQHMDDTQQISTASEDMLGSLSNVRIDDLDDPWVRSLIEDGNVTDPQVSVLQQIGYFWATNRTDQARNLTQILVDQQYPRLGARLTIDNVEVYARNTTLSGGDTMVATRMVSGVAQGKAITGSSAVAYLRRIKEKRTAAFVPIGGFIGEGNITMRFLELPADANISSIHLEMAAGAPFQVAFNGAPCGGAYAAPVYDGTPHSWDLSACNGSLTPGAMNVVRITFSSDLNQSYIAGGYLRVRYRTATFSEGGNGTFVQYRFPGIQGIINLYDAFYVPGTLRNMTIYLHYNASNATYLDVGEKRVWEDDANGTERVVTLNDSFLRDPLLGRLDYDFLSNKTIPLRFSGFEYNSVVVTSGDADVILITDFSGSMKKAVSDWDQGNLGSDCASAYTDNDVRRTLLAQCVDKELVGTVMNYSGNRLWPVFIHRDRVQYYNNPSNGPAISGYIDSYANGDGKTCYACALNLAHDILANYSNSTRKKFVVFMTDGSPTHCAAGGCASSSMTFGAMQCAGLCDQNGACDQTDIPGQCNACIASPGGRDNAYVAANRLRNDFNATIYTVGFGPITDCSFAGQTLTQLASIGNGTYQHSSDSAQLRLIYSNISQEILSKSTLIAQVANVVGPQTRSRLFEDSHINVTYEIASQYLPSQNEIAITLQSDQACDPVLQLFPEQRLIEAKALTYSGTHWADYLSIGGTEVYNLSSFLLPYDQLGDPTLIHAPLSLFGGGANTLHLETGDSPVNRTGCLGNNSAIYIVAVNLSTERSQVVPGSEGCRWTVEFEDNTTESITVPSSYAGTNACSYTRTNITYDAEDAYQLGAYTIFNRLDFRKEGAIFVNLRDEDLEVIVTTISHVPFMWGPSIVRMEVTR